MSAAYLKGQSGAGMLPPLRIVHRVEQMHVTGKGRTYHQVGDDHGVREFANQQAERLRSQGFTVRVRPVVL